MVILLSLFFLSTLMCFAALLDFVMVLSVDVMVEALEGVLAAEEHIFRPVVWKDHPFGLLIG